VTAKEDQRWVRGNAGVLLQLLESRTLCYICCRTDMLTQTADRELSVVKSVLGKMMTMSPIPVFNVMADDCKGSEDETGASRRIIIEYLYKDCAEFRRTVLAAGKSPAAEVAFRSNFAEVLKFASPAETTMILEMLVPLPSISGKNANRETTNAFVRSLTDSIKSSVTNKEKRRHVQLFAALAARPVSLAPELALYFFSKHGGAVVYWTLTRGDPQASSLVERLRAWAEEAVKQWQQKPASAADEKVIKRCVTEVLDELLVCHTERCVMHTLTSRHASRPRGRPISCALSSTWSGSSYPYTTSSAMYVELHLVSPAYS
jgi:hypothetical protein